MNYQIPSGVLFGQGCSGRGRAEFEARYDGDGLDTGMPGKPNVVADAERRHVWGQAPVLARIWGILGEDLRERNLGCLGSDGVEVAEIRADEAADERSGDVVRVTLDHECVIEHTRAGKAERAKGIAEEDASDDRGTRRTETAAERDLVVRVDVAEGAWKGAVVIAAEDVQRDAGEEVAVRVEGDLVCAFACVADLEGPTRRRSKLNGEREMEGEGEADHVKAGSDVGRGGRDFDLDGRASRRHDQSC